MSSLDVFESSIMGKRFKMESWNTSSVYAVDESQVANCHIDKGMTVISTDSATNKPLFFLI